MKESEAVYKFKIIFVGHQGTGKTSLIRRFVKNTFTTNYKATVGADFALKRIEVDNKSVDLQLWDIAGQERFGNMTPIFYKGASGAVIVFDITSLKTLERVKLWKDDIKNKIKTDDSIPHILLCNKVDLVGDMSPCISDEELEKFRIENGFDGCFKTSAKEGKNINEAIEFITKLILEKAEPISVDDDAKGFQIVEKEESKETRKSECCLRSH